MSNTGVVSLDRSIDTTNGWLSDVAEAFGTKDGTLAYRVTRAWLHTLRDRLPVPVAAQLAAQLPDLLRGVFDAEIHGTEAARSGRLVTAALRWHLSSGVIDEALAVLPADMRDLIESTDQAPVTGGGR